MIVQSKSDQAVMRGPNWFHTSAVLYSAHEHFNIVKHMYLKIN